MSRYENYSFKEDVNGFFTEDKEWSNDNTSVVAEWMEDEIGYDRIREFIEDALEEEDVVETLANSLEAEVGYEGEVTTDVYGVFGDWLEDEYQWEIEQTRQEYLAEVDWNELAEDILKNMGTCAA